MNTPAPSVNTLPEPAEPALEGFVMDAMVWYCVKALLAPLWTPVKGTAPVTSFDYSKAFKALHEKEGRPAVLGVSGVATQDLVMAQAERMALVALEMRRNQERLAKQENERHRREEECRRLAKKEIEEIGDFTVQ